MIHPESFPQGIDLPKHYPIHTDDGNSDSGKPNRESYLGEHPALQRRLDNFNREVDDWRRHDIMKHVYGGSNDLTDRRRHIETFQQLQYEQHGVGKNGTAHTLAFQVSDDHTRAKLFQENQDI